MLWHITSRATVYSVNLESGWAEYGKVVRYGLRCNFDMTPVEFSTVSHGKQERD
jgi:hypothetical protein